MNFANDEDKLTLIDELDNYKDINFQIQFLLNLIIQQVKDEDCDLNYPLEGIMTLLEAQNLVINGFNRYIQTGDINQWKTLQD